MIFYVKPHLNIIFRLYKFFNTGGFHMIFGLLRDIKNGE